MLEAAAALPEHIQEDVALERKEAPEPAGLAHHLLDVLRRLRSVPGRILARIGDDVGRAVDDELPVVERAGDDGRIDERVEVGGAIVVRLSSRRRFQAGDRRPPGRRQLDADLVRARRPVSHVMKVGAAVDHAEAGVHPVRRDRPSLAEEAIGHERRRAIRWSTTRHRFGAGLVTSSVTPSGVLATSDCTRAA